MLLGEGKCLSRGIKNVTLDEIKSAKKGQIGMSNQSKRIVAFGGGGYIGSHTVLVLLEAGYEVVVVDNCSNAVAGKDGSLVQITFNDNLQGGGDAGVPVALGRVQEITGKCTDFHNFDVLDFNATLELLRKVFCRALVFVKVL